MVHAFYGVRTGFIRRGGVSFFTWLGQLAGVVVSFQERRILDDWGAECRVYGLLRHAVPKLTQDSTVAKADKPDSVLC